MLFADADGATTFEDIVKLEESLAEIEVGGHGIVCGSRAHLEEESIASRTVIRTILMYGFHACVWIFAVKTVQDTQCGFKVTIINTYSIKTIKLNPLQLIKRKTAQILFKTLHIERWAFDVEMLKVLFILL